MTGKLNEVVFGPLQLNGEFDYNISDICEINEETLKYVESIGDQKIKFINAVNASMFTRVIKLDLGYMQPIIGIFTVKLFNHSYNISHVSIHRLFRNQGLSKLFMTSFANYLSGENNVKTFVTCVIPENLVNGYSGIVELFRSLNFIEVKMGTYKYMSIPTKNFIKLINSPIDI